MTKAKTPFEKAGYAKETKFKMLMDFYYKKGEIVTLSHDDGSDCPRFINSGGRGYYLYLPNMRPKTEGEQHIEVYREAPEEKETAASALFSVGTEVKIAKSSQYYTGNDISSNPKDIKGIVVSNRHDESDYFYYVKWDNGTNNSYRLNDLVLWTEDKVVDSEGWIEWNGDSEPPVIRGTKVDVKYHDGNIAIGIGSQDGSKAEGCDYVCSTWRHNPKHPNIASIIAYRLHVPIDTSVASQETITETLEDKPSVSIDSDEDASEDTTEPMYEAGDLVEITDCLCGHRFDIGEIVRLTSGSEGSWRAEHLDGRAYWQIFEDEYKPANKLAVGVDEVAAKPSLISVTKDVKYSVSIKGTLFEFTQDEMNELISELEGFEDYE